MSAMTTTRYAHVPMTDALSGNPASLRIAQPILRDLVAATQGSSVPGTGVAAIGMDMAVRPRTGTSASTPVFAQRIDRSASRRAPA